MLAPHSTLLSGIFFNSTEQFPDVVNSREACKAVLSPSPELGTREAVFLRRNSKTQTPQLELYARFSLSQKRPEAQVARNLKSTGVAKGTRPVGNYPRVRKTNKNR